VLRALAVCPGLPPISLDTTKADVAERAFGEGLAQVLNDVHGLLGEPALAEVAARYGVGVVVMHNARLRPVAGDLITAMQRFFAESFAVAEHAGIAREALVIDPGVGFGLSVSQSLEALQRIAELRALQSPILLGASRKRVLGHLLEGAPAEDRLEGTLATTACGVAAGVDLFRVHDVRANVRVARVADALCRR
jgi:dihydropteroate synthase